MCAFVTLTTPHFVLLYEEGIDYLLAPRRSRIDISFAKWVTSPCLQQQLLDPYLCISLLHPPKKFKFCPWVFVLHFSQINHCVWIFRFHGDLSHVHIHQLQTQASSEKQNNSLVRSWWNSRSTAGLTPGKTLRNFINIRWCIYSSGVKLGQKRLITAGPFWKHSSSSFPTGTSLMKCL